MSDDAQAMTKVAVLVAVILSIGIWLSNQSFVITDRNGQAVWVRY